MAVGASLAFAMVRVPRGAARPSEEEFRAALAVDRDLLRMPTLKGACELVVGGPYAIHVGGKDLDEWVAWER